MPTNFTCAGSEPSWSLELNRGRAQLNSPNEELRNGGMEFTGRAGAVANHLPMTVVWRGRGTKGGKGGDLVAMVMTARCEEPNGATTPYRVWLSLPEGAALTGCCR